MSLLERAIPWDRVTDDKHQVCGRFADINLGDQAYTWRNATIHWQHVTRESTMNIPAQCGFQRAQGGGGVAAAGSFYAFTGKRHRIRRCQRAFTTTASTSIRLCDP